MKRTLCAALILVSILAAGCGSQSNAGVSSNGSESRSGEARSSAVSQEEPTAFPKLRQLLLTDSPDYIDLYRYSPVEGVQTGYRITREVLTELYDLIMQEALEPFDAESGIPWDAEKYHVLYRDFASGYPEYELEIIRSGTGSDGKTLLTMPWDEQNPENPVETYSASEGLYEKVSALLEPMVYQPKASFSGEGIPLEGAVSVEGVYPASVVEQDGLLAYCSPPTVVSVYGTASGKQVFSVTTADPVVRIAPIPKGFRVMTTGEVLDYAEGGGVLAQWKLPEEVREALPQGDSMGNVLNSRYQYDTVGQKIAYVTEEGVSVHENGVSRQVLSNEALSAVLMETDEWYQTYGAANDSLVSFSDVRLLGNGRYLSSVINLIDSQNGYYGISLTDLVSGETAYFFDVYSVWNLQTDYLEDQIRITTDEQISVIDVGTMSCTRTPYQRQKGTVSISYSPDGKTQLEERTYRDEQGHACLEYSSRPAASPQQEGRRLLTITQSDHCFLSAVTDHLLFFTGLPGSADSGPWIAPY